MKVLNVGSTKGSCDQQALDTDRIQLKDTITSLRIQLDGLKVENVSLKRKYDELSKANTHSRIAYTDKLSALTAGNNQLKAQVTGKTSSEPSTSETPKVLCSGMYNLGVKPLLEQAKTVPKERLLGIIVFAGKSAECEQTKRFKRQPKKEWKPIKNVGNPIKRVWKPISKPVANNKPQWKPWKHLLFIEQAVQIVLWYLDSGCSRHMTGDRARLINFVEKFIGTVRFGNDEYAAIVGYGDYKLGDTIISRVYYVEGLKHNLFSVGQFCDGGLEVAFRQHSCYIRNSDMVDLLKGSRTTNLYSISLNDMMSASPVCLLTKASSTKSWLWHRRLNHLNFGTLNELARNNLVRGLPMLKYDKEFVSILSARFGWVRFLRTKDETPQVIEKFIVKTQRALNATVRFVRTDNGTEFVNKTLDGWFESVGISHETSVPRSPQQNGVVERRNRTLMEAARTMLIFAKAPLFLWAEAVATACYTLNRSLVHTLQRDRLLCLAPQQMSSVSGQYRTRLTALQSGRKPFSLGTENANRLPSTTVISGKALLQLLNALDSSNTSYQTFLKFLSIPAQMDILKLSWMNMESAKEQSSVVVKGYLRKLCMDVKTPSSMATKEVVMLVIPEEHLHQPIKYAQEIFPMEKFVLTHAHPIDTPMADVHDTRRSTSGSALFLDMDLLAGHQKSRKVLPSPLRSLNTSAYHGMLCSNPWEAISSC
ncbi:retrovirus-related pol polyprotein from transposon TNT 1-94 [Tanacetum coccineum]